MNKTAKAVLQIHLFVAGYKHIGNNDSTAQTAQAVNGPVMNWILVHDIQITCPLVAGLSIEFPRVFVEEGRYTVILGDVRKYEQSPLDGVFRIQDVQDWTYSVGDGVYKAAIEVEVASRDIAKVYRDQLIEGFGFKDISLASLT